MVTSVSEDDEINLSRLPKKRVLILLIAFMALTSGPLGLTPNRLLPREGSEYFLSIATPDERSMALINMTEVMVPMLRCVELHIRLSTDALIETRNGARYKNEGKHVIIGITSPALLHP
jgi:hypothetical protein